MRDKEFVLGVSDVAPELPSARSHEQTCEECGRQFHLENVSLWVYKLIVKGQTHWFCRYNCMRAGERKVSMNKNKPTKTELEKDLRTDMTLALIAEKYACSIATISNWTKAYDLQGIRGIKKASGESVVDCPAHVGLDLSRIPSVCPDEPEPDDDEPLLTDEEIAELESRSAELGGSAPSAEPEHEPEPYGEVWGDLRDDIVTLRRLYAQDADRTFFERLHGLFLEVRG